MKNLIKSKACFFPGILSCNNGVFFLKQLVPNMILRHESKKYIFVTRYLKNLYKCLNLKDANLCNKKKKRFNLQPLSTTMLSKKLKNDWIQKIVTYLFNVFEMSQC